MAGGGGWTLSPGRGSGTVLSNPRTNGLRVSSLPLKEDMLPGQEKSKLLTPKRGAAKCLFAAADLSTEVQGFLWFPHDLILPAQLTTAHESTARGLERLDYHGSPVEPL